MRRAITGSDSRSSCSTRYDVVVIVRGTKKRFVLAVAVLAALTSSCAWPLGGFDQGRTGAGVDAVINTGNVSTLTEAWHVTLPASRVVGLVADDGAVFATAGARLAALETGTGQERWHVDLPASGSGTPRFGMTSSHRHVVYAGRADDASAVTGALDGYDTTDGHVVWTGEFPEGSSFPGPHATEGAPIVRDDAVVADVSVAQSVPPASRDMAVYEPDGSLRETMDARGGYATAGGSLYVSGVQVFDLARNGQCRFQRGPFVWICDPTWRTSVAATRPTVAGGTLYATSDDGTLYAFDADGCGSTVCAPLWSADLGGSLIDSGIAVANGVVYVTTEDSFEGDIRAFSADGCGDVVCAPLWSSTGWGPFPSAPSVAGGVVYFGAEDGMLLAFDASGCGAATCVPVWQTTLDHSIATQPIIAYGHVIVGTVSGDVVAFALPASHQ